MHAANGPSTSTTPPRACGRWGLNSLIFRTSPVGRSAAHAKIRFDLGRKRQETRCDGEYLTWQTQAHKPISQAPIYLLDNASTTGRREIIDTWRAGLNAERNTASPDRCILNDVSGCDAALDRDVGGCPPDSHSRPPGKNLKTILNTAKASMKPTLVEMTAVSSSHSPS